MESENEGKTEYLDIGNMKTVVTEEELNLKDDTQPRKIERINRNYDFLFLQPDRENIRIRKLVNEYYSHLITKRIGIKTIAMRLRLRFIEKVKQLYISEESIWNRICFLTCDIDSEMREKVLESLQMNSLVKEVKENNGIIRLETTFGEIKFSDITNFFPNLKVDDKIKKLKNRIRNIEETGDCHKQAIEYSKKLKRIGIDNDVVTANRSIVADKINSLHSWNEFQIDGKEHVLDYTQNVIMNKEGYYALSHIQRIISRVNCVDIENDPKIYQQIDNGESYIDFKTYLTCRDEIMRDLQKNIDIFHDER